MLRGAGVSLAEIRGLIADLETDREAAVRRLDRHLTELELRHTSRRLQATDLVGIRTEPAHDEAFTTITKAEWAYPAILAAYDAVSCSPEATARPGSRLSCREVYLAEPHSIGDDELVCDIAFPLG